MLSINQETLLEAEALAARGEKVENVLATLRKLPLDDFGLLLISLPNPTFPHLSTLLPEMASAEAQNNWTGSSGIELLRQTMSFVRQLENISCRYAGRSLMNETILDFGCGYGRIIRLLYYYTNPNSIWGIDAWERSLEECRRARILGNLALSDVVPEQLPTNETFGFGFAFSIFTHLPPHVATACLKAIRKNLRTNGLFVLTIRPIEFWEYIDSVRGTSCMSSKSAEHEKLGYAYLPHNGPEGETYGDASYCLAFFQQPSWSVVAYDRSLADPYQIAVILKAV